MRDPLPASLGVLGWLFWLALAAPAWAQDAALQQPSVPSESSEPVPPVPADPSPIPSESRPAAPDPPPEPAAQPETTEPQSSEPQPERPVEIVPPAEPAQPVPTEPPATPPVAVPSESAPRPATPPQASSVNPLEAARPVAPPVAESPTAWAVSLTTGYYRPRLGTFNRILRDTAITVLQDPNFLLPRNQNFPFEARNLPAPAIDGGPTYGIDAFYNAGGAHSFGLSFSSWRGESFADDTISLFLRSNIPPVDVPRSARYNLILDRIFLEWRYHLLRDARGRGVYLNVGLVGVSLAFLTMDSLVNVVHPLLSFAAVSSDESFGWGYTSRFGFGADYPLTSWLSVGGHANYVLATVPTMTVTRHFLAGFPETPITEPFSLRPGIPLPQTFFPPREGRTVTHASVTTTGEVEERAGPTTNLALELSGLEAFFKLTIHF